MYHCEPLPGVWLKLELCMSTVVTAPMFQKQRMLIESWPCSEANRSGDDCHWEDSLLLTVPERGAVPCHDTRELLTHQDRHWDRQRAEGTEENMKKCFNCSFYRKGWVRQGKQA